MITKEELVGIKKHRNIPLYYLEKEYFQYVFLYALSRFADKVVFKGGTCLRLCYGLERASEDLDFSCSLPIQNIRTIVKQCMESFSSLGILFSEVTEKEFEGNIRFEVKIQGPLYTGNPNSTNSLKIDFNKQKVNRTNAVVIKQVYSDVPLFVIVALAEEEILTEKLRTLANRQQGRDLYDVWVLLGKGVQLDKELLQKKLKEENVKINEIRLLSRQAYEQDLRNLVRLIPSYEQVRKDVEGLLARLR